MRITVRQNRLVQIWTDDLIGLKFLYLCVIVRNTE